MAIDSRDKRASAIGLALAWARTAPVPDGTLSAADRQHIAGAYRGIDIGNVVAFALAGRLRATDGLSRRAYSGAVRIVRLL